MNAAVRELLDELGDCPKCGGQGMRTVYVGRYGGSVECDLCDGTGDTPDFTCGGELR